MTPETGVTIGTLAAFVVIILIGLIVISIYLLQISNNSEGYNMNGNRYDKIHSAFDSFIAIIDVLIEDAVKLCNSITEDPTNDFWTRNLVRAFFAMVEGATFNLKQVALAVHEVKPCFTEAELVILQEKEYILTNRGRAKETNKKIGTLANFKFAIKSTYKAFDLEDEARFEGEGWELFLEVLKIRDKMTHPKNVADISMDQLQPGIVPEAVEWYSNYMKELMRTIAAKIQTWEENKTNEG